jgi:hypothetical protein
MGGYKMKDWKGMKDGREKYHAYLASREWALLKKQVRARSGGKCEHCRVAEGTETHHTTYIRKYREKLEDLMHVCRECHEFLSGHGTVDPALRQEKSGGGVTISGGIVYTGFLGGCFEDEWIGDAIGNWNEVKYWKPDKNTLADWDKNGRCPNSMVLQALSRPDIFGEKSSLVMFGTFPCYKTSDFYTEYDALLYATYLFWKRKHGWEHADVLFSWAGDRSYNYIFREIGFFVGADKPYFVYHNGGAKDPKDISDEFLDSCVKEFCMGVSIESMDPNVGQSIYDSDELRYKAALLVLGILCDYNKDRIFRNGMDAFNAFNDLAGL